MKLNKAVELFENGEFVKAFPLFDELLLLYRGTDKAEHIYYYYSLSEYEKEWTFEGSSWVKENTKLRTDL